MVVPATPPPAAPAPSPTSSAPASFPAAPPAVTLAIMLPPPAAPRPCPVAAGRRRGQSPVLSTPPLLTVLPPWPPVTVLPIHGAGPPGCCPRALVPFPVPVKRRPAAWPPALPAVPIPAGTLAAEVPVPVPVPGRVPVSVPVPIPVAAVACWAAAAVAPSSAALTPVVFMARAFQRGRRPRRRALPLPWGCGEGSAGGGESGACVRIKCICDTLTVGSHACSCVIIQTIVAEQALVCAATAHEWSAVNPRPQEQTFSHVQDVSGTSYVCSSNNDNSCVA